jgi:hypothetical protein
VEGEYGRTRRPHKEHGRCFTPKTSRKQNAGQRAEAQRAKAGARTKNTGDGAWLFENRIWIEEAGKEFRSSPRPVFAKASTG